MHYYDSQMPTPLDRLSDLTDQLADLARRVRMAVTEALAETCARIARDAAERLLRPGPEPVRGYAGRYEEDPWDNAPPTQSESYPMTLDRDRAALGQAIAAGLAAAGWWARRGNPVGSQKRDDQVCGIGAA